MKTFLILIVIERYLKSSDSLPRSSAVTHTANTENTVRNIMTALNMDKLCEERKREEAHRLCSCVCGGGGSERWSHDCLRADADWLRCVKRTGVRLTGRSDALDYVSLNTHVLLFLQNETHFGNELQC